MTKMQKIFLSMLATASAFSFASADCGYYLTGSAGALMSSKYVKSGLNSDTRKIQIKRSATALEFGIGAGYHVLDNLRVEALYVKPLLNDGKIQKKDAGDADFSKLYSVKTNLDSLQLRGYYDLTDLKDFGKLYVGAGVGVSYLRGKLTDASNTYKFKGRYNVAFAVGVGGEFEVANNTKLGVEYNYSDHGKAKTEKDSSVFYKTPVRGHSILAKLRFEI